MNAALVLLVLASMPAFSATPPKTGSACTKSGLVKTYQGKKYTCMKSGKKLVWSKGVAINEDSKLVNPTPKPSPLTKVQVVTWKLPSYLKQEDSPYELGATASSGLRVDYKSKSPATCAIESNTLKLLATGECLLTISQAGNSFFAPATVEIKTTILAKITSLAPPSGMSLPASAFPSNRIQTNPTLSANPVLTVLPEGKVGEKYEYIFKAEGGSHPPYFIKPSPTLMPPGMTFNIMSGLFSGVPSKPGKYKFTLGAFDTDYANPNAAIEYSIGKYVNNAYANFELTITGQDNPNIPWFTHDWANTDITNPFPIDSNFLRYGGELSIVTIDGVPAASLTAAANKGFNAGGWQGTEITKATQAYLGIEKRFYSGRLDWTDDEGLETWTRTRVFFPVDYAPSGLFNGEWNWIEEWHTDNYTQMQNGNSMALGVFSSKWDTNFRGTSPRFVFRLMGGDINNKQIDSTSCSTKEGAFKFQHWYDVVIHMFWSSDPKKGKVELWIDGSRVCSINFPTLYTLADGKRSWNNGFGMYNYRPMHNWSSTVYFGQFSIGPTAQSVGFRIP